MKWNLLVLVGVYGVSVGLVSWLWPSPWVLLICLAIMSVLMLIRWHTRADLAFYLAAFFLGPLGEAVAVRFGAWEYSQPLKVIPVWLPLLWGIVALFLKRLSETLAAAKPLERRTQPRAKPTIRSVDRYRDRA